MANVNKVILIGNLTQDPELRYTNTQRPVTDLRLAVNRFVGGGGAGEDTERREETLFIDVTVWDRQAENCCQYLAKGRSVYVEGYLRLDTWDDKQTGEKRSKIKAVAQVVQFLDGRRDDPGRGEEAGALSRPAEPRRAASAATRPAAPRGQNAGVGTAAGTGPNGGAAQPPNDEDIPF